MTEDEFWGLIDGIRETGTTDAEEVADRAAEVLAGRSREEITGVQAVIDGLLARSRTTPLRAAAHLIGGGRSDDGFDHFRGWLITQGRVVFATVVDDPDKLAALPAVQRARADGAPLECEDALAIASTAHLAAFGTDLPLGSLPAVPRPRPDTEGDFDDPAELRRHCPRLAALYLT
ncbi:DUF4240 domain-containing protein [Actinomadura parmotrematis]|uniref:DUF4240 domain-containing protein n=1 Tax=Actinomadura parmotrematis TaxID=2864039 RepID=A0ABS7G3K6_9ACTN|nr:DUF4240 domain-containing protein [Actinomadura parmotrematis]MBW8486940.1 DUF4240 domain-containing protein [Actinomadura parmotrematis]